MKYLIYSIFFVLISCSQTENLLVSEKPLTKNIPSTDKTILEGRSLNTASSITKTANQNTTQEYTLIERLYNTVWFQTEKDYDDGRLEIETEFIMFNDKSWVVEREVENGKMERVEADDYKYLQVVKDDILDDKNAAIVLAQELGDDDVEYQGFWLKDENTLYVIEAETIASAVLQLKAIIAQPALAHFNDTEKYILSVNKQ